MDKHQQWHQQLDKTELLKGKNCLQILMRIVSKVFLINWFIFLIDVNCGWWKEAVH
jgi:hypothetical protein